jgi:DNA-binding CsgD family transcriptional regulator
MDAFEKLAMQVHEAAIETQYFPDLAQNISDFIGAGSIHMLLFDPSDNVEHLSLFERGDTAFSDEYLRDYIALDFRVPRVLAQKPGALVEESSYVGREEARRSEIHQSLLPKYGIHNIAGSNLGIGETIGWYGMSSRRIDRPFDGPQLRLAAGLMPHLHLAYRTILANDQAARAKAAMAAALDGIGAAVFVFNRGEPTFANMAADALLDEGFFRLLSWRLGCREEEYNRRVAELFSSSIGSQRSLIVHDNATGVAYHLRVITPSTGARTARSAKMRERIATVTALNPAGAPSREALEAFANMYKLTAREADIVGAVLAFVSLKQFADDNGIALDTVQKHLKSALARMGLHSQKALFQSFERYRLMGG